MISAAHPRLYAQGEAAIYGRVTAQADGSAVPATSIQLESPEMPTALAVASDDLGRFTFQGLVPGSYTPTASHEAFQTCALRVTLKPREARNVTLDLVVRGISESVFVTAPAESTAVAYSPGSTMFDHAFVEELPLGQRNNLPDMIAASAPGMIRSHDDFVHVRGNEIALNTSINGVSFWENPHSVFSAGLSPDIVQSVNVMTGAFPAEYGNGHQRRNQGLVENGSDGRWNEFPNPEDEYRRPIPA